jgi:hypothetical protein
MQYKCHNIMVEASQTDVPSQNNCIRREPQTKLQTPNAQWFTGVSFLQGPLHTAAVYLASPSFFNIICFILLCSSPKVRYLPW